ITAVAEPDVDTLRLSDELVLPVCEKTTDPGVMLPSAALSPATTVIDAGGGGGGGGGWRRRRRCRRDRDRIGCDRFVRSAAVVRAIGREGDRVVADRGIGVKM